MKRVIAFGLPITSQPRLYWSFVGQTIRALLLAGALLPKALLAAPFNSGSTGSYGPLNITSNTVLALPPDGILNCTTITVSPNTTLQFTRNALNTPVYLLATGDIIVSGQISVSGESPAGNVPGHGGPGGFDGGFGGFAVGATFKGGDGQGPGAGRNQGLMQHAVFGQPVNNNTNTYGNTLLVPLIGGSGGAGTDGNPGGYGGGGGGAILLASNTKISIIGSVVSDGGGGFGAGSGGGIRLVAPIVGGTGVLRARSPYSGPSGRIRIDSEDRIALRSLSVEAGTVSRGSQMYVFPAVVPRLDIIQAAGKVIPEGTGSAVQVDLPAGSSTNQTIVLQGRNFTGTVPITVAVVPENGPSSIYTGQLTGAGSSPAQVTVNVVLNPGFLSRITAWAR